VSGQGRGGGLRAAGPGAYAPGPDLCLHTSPGLCWNARQCADPLHWHARASLAHPGVRAEKVKQQQAAAVAKKSEFARSPRARRPQPPPRLTRTAWLLSCLGVSPLCAVSVARAAQESRASANPLAPPPPPPRPCPAPPCPVPSDKKTLNLGKSGLSAGLDDYVYDGLGQDDEYDFM
jgi:hypothetical protein